MGMKQLHVPDGREGREWMEKFKVISFKCF